MTAPTETPPEGGTRPDPTTVTPGVDPNDMYGDPTPPADPPPGPPQETPPEVPPEGDPQQTATPPTKTPPDGSGESDTDPQATPPKPDGEGDETPPATEEFEYEFLAEGEEYPAFTYPDGTNVDTKLEERMRSKFKELVAGKGLSSADANSLVAEFVQHMTDVDEAAQAQEQATRDGWRDEIIADPVMGGPKFERSKELVGLGKQHLLTQGGQLGEFVQLCNETAIGDNPAAFAVLRYIGLHFVAEPSPPDDTTGQEKEVDLRTMSGVADALYGGSKGGES